MKADDIRDWDDAELDTRLKELKEEQFKLRFSSSMMEMENNALIGQVRRDIARLKTIIRERALVQTASES